MAQVPELPRIGSLSATYPAGLGMLGSCQTDPARGKQCASFSGLKTSIARLSRGAATLQFASTCCSFPCSRRGGGSRPFLVITSMGKFRCLLGALGKTTNMEGRSLELLPSREYSST